MTAKVRWPDHLRVIPALAWTIFIVYALLSEPSSIPRFHWLDFVHADKVIHAALFVIESGLIYWAFYQRGWTYLIVAVLIWSVLIGGGLELLQHYWVEGRLGEPMDLLADFVGAVLATTAFKAISKYF